MLGIGIGEMILIAGIALVIFGPEKFPDFAKIALRTLRDLRGYVDEVQTEISKEIKPVKRELEQLGRYDPGKYIDSLTKSSPPPSSRSVSTAQHVQYPAATGGDDANGRNDDSFDYAEAAEGIQSDIDSAQAPTTGQEEGNTENDTQAGGDQEKGMAFEEPGAAPERLG